METFALQLQHHIHHVFQHLGAGQRAFFGHMTDEKDGDVVLLAATQERRRTIAHLADRAGGAGTAGAMNRLHRIDNDQRRFDRFDLLQDLFHFDLGKDQQVTILNIHARGPAPHLMDTLLSADIENRTDTFGNLGGHVEQQGAFANPRFATHQHTAARHNATAQDAIHLGHAQGETRHALLGNIRQRDRTRCRGAGRQEAALALLLLAYDKLLQRIPFAAIGTFAHPFHLSAATFGADVLGFCFGHRWLVWN